jgi:hypothetical protein
MKTIKKTTLIATVAAMAAFAVPSMASALTWAPLNTNKTLTSTNVNYAVPNDSNGVGFQCSSSTLGVHVRGPASSTLDITSASFTGCSLTATACFVTGPITVTATGLPWAATVNSSSVVSYTHHLQVTNNPCWPGTTFTVNGPSHGWFFKTDHKLSNLPDYPNMKIFYMAQPWGNVSGGPDPTWWHETTNTLTLN